MRGRIILLVRFEVLKDVTMKINVYRVMTPWNGEEAGIPVFPRNLITTSVFIYISIHYLPEKCRQIAPIKDCITSQNIAV